MLPFVWLLFLRIKQCENKETVLTGAVSGSMGARSPLIYEESAGRGHYPASVSITCLIWARLGSSGCTCGSSSGNILGTPTCLL